MRTKETVLIAGKTKMEIGLDLIMSGFDDMLCVHDFFEPAEKRRSEREKKNQIREIIRGWIDLLKE